MFGKDYQEFAQWPFCLCSLWKVLRSGLHIIYEIYKFFKYLGAIGDCRIHYKSMKKHTHCYLTMKYNIPIGPHVSLVNVGKYWRKHSNILYTVYKSHGSYGDRSLDSFRISHLKKNMACAWNSKNPIKKWWNSCWMMIHPYCTLKKWWDS